MALDLKTKNNCQSLPAGGHEGNSFRLLGTDTTPTETRV